MSQQQQHQYIPRENPAYLPSGVLNFFISLMPGAGHMYQGLMQRGTVLMAAFAGSIALTAFFSSMWGLTGVRDLLVGIAVIGMVITYFYSFFDSLRTCRLMRSGVWMADKMDALDTALKLPDIDFAKRGRVIAGAALTVIGVLGVVSFAFNRLIPRGIVDAYLRPGMEMLVPVAFLVAGVLLLVKGRKAAAKAE